MVFSIRAGRLAKEGRLEEARIEGERARDWCWYSIGIGLAVYFVLFIAVLFTVRDGVLGTSTSGATCCSAPTRGDRC